MTNAFDVTFSVDTLTEHDIRVWAQPHPLQPKPDIPTVPLAGVDVRGLNIKSLGNPDGLRVLAAALLEAADLADAIVDAIVAAEQTPVSA
jgi:hypothetical protein